MSKPEPTEPRAGGLLLSELIGRHVFAREVEEEHIGRVVDLVVSDRGPMPPVRQVVVRQRRRHDERLLPWSSVDLVGAGTLRFVASARSASELEVVEHGLRLVRDVLDAQIVDLSGHRLVRVGDVQLVRRSDGELRLVGVDVGFGAVVRRLGLHRLGHQLAAKVVPWSTLHLTSRRGHQVQLGSRASRLTELSAEDLAHLLTRLSTAHAVDVVRAVPPSTAREAFRHTHEDVAGRVLGELGDEHAQAVLAELPREQATRLRRIARRPGPRRRYRRTRGWKRHAPRERVG